MSGKKKSTSGFDPRFKKYKSGLNIMDEITKIHMENKMIISKINSIVDDFFIKIKSLNNNTTNYHYFMTLLLHDKINIINKMKFNDWLKENLCSFFTSVYRDGLRKYQPKIFNKGKNKLLDNI